MATPTRNAAAATTLRNSQNALLQSSSFILLVYVCSAAIGHDLEQEVYMGADLKQEVYMAALRGAQSHDTVWEGFVTRLG